MHLPIHLHHYSMVKLHFSDVNFFSFFTVMTEQTFRSSYHKNLEKLDLGDRGHDLHYYLTSRVGTRATTKSWTPTVMFLSFQTDRFE